MGAGYLGDGIRVPVVLGDLIAKHEVPPMIGIFVNPGVLPTVSADVQNRFERVFGLFFGWGHKTIGSVDGAGRVRLIHPGGRLLCRGEWRWRGPGDAGGERCAGAVQLVVSDCGEWLD
jgi:hypothetical protein